jgi:replicative DNA helicase
MSIILSDIISERGVIAGICRYNAEAFYDVVDLLQESTFNNETNKYLYQCIKHIFNKSSTAKLDLPTLQAAAHELGIAYIFVKKEEIQYIQALFDFPIDIENVRKLAAKIRKLEIAKLLHGQLEEAQVDLSKVKGNETITHILGLAEERIFDFTKLLNDQSDAPERLGSDAEEVVTELANNPVTQVGIPTGFKAYDKAIGGGLREGTVNVISARIKLGKSVLGDNIGTYIAKKGIPVLNMDTEMLKADHQYRTLANMSDVTINEIETGKFGINPSDRKKVIESAKQLKTIPYFHKNISGMPFEDQIAIMRRWLAKDVGLNPDGTAKPCVLIYDYIKLMDTVGIENNMAEHQLIGFIVTSLQNFAAHYKVPILAFCQQNRTGITKEDTGTASQSDRILWFCANFTIFKSKSDDELAEDGFLNGNRKLVVLVCRHGEGLAPGDYINCHMDGRFGRVREGKTKFELIQEQKAKNAGGFVTQD